ncbi:hypothetical protein B5E56_05565 [Flavonifractor sp. An112]|nr:hypothetical protein B5E56_05565 [Flavonifractor sp. An112]
MRPGTAGRSGRLRRPTAGTFLNASFTLALPHADSHPLDHSGAFSHPQRGAYTNPHPNHTCVG